MWPDGETESGMGRASSGSEVVIMDERVLALANASSPSQINVTGSNLVHVGPKFVSVNQTVHNREVIKDLSLPMYLWSVLKSTTRAERLSCAAAILFLTICVTLIIVYVLNKRDAEIDTHDKDDWNISRDKWLAQTWVTDETTEEFEPLRLVIVQHSVSTECYTFKNCAAEMRILQNYFIKKFDYDIPYNFLIGNDGRVYEGRGWGKVGAHTRFYNRCSLGIGFVGDYREEISAHASVSPLQVKRTQMLLDYGVLKGYLHPDYHILAAKDIQDTASPGSNLYNELQTWRHYNNGTNYVNKSCEEMYAEFKDKDG